MLHHLLTHVSPTILVATFLLAGYLTQQSGTPLLFLPAGIQLLAGFVYGIRCLPGCIIGIGLGSALLAHHPLTENSLAISSLAGALSTLCLLSAIYLVCRIGRVNDELAGLSYRHILIVVTLQALADAALRTTLMPMPEHTATAQFLTQASGNLLGSMAVAFSLWILAGLRQKHS